MIEWPAGLRSIFRDPDVSDPIGELLRRDRHLLAVAPGMIGTALVPIGVALAGLTTLASRRSAPATLWAIAAAGSFLLVLLHPLTSEIPRLLAPLWLSVAIGLGGLAAIVARFAHEKGLGYTRGVRPL